MLARNTLPLAILILAALFFGRNRARVGSLQLRCAIILGAFVACALCLRSSRFLDYLVPLLAITAGLFWPRDTFLPIATWLRTPTIVALATVGAILGWAKPSLQYVQGESAPSLLREIFPQVGGGLCNR